MGHQTGGGLGRAVVGGVGAHFCDVSREKLVDKWPPATPPFFFFGGGSFCWFLLCRRTLVRNSWGLIEQGPT